MHVVDPCRLAYFAALHVPFREYDWEELTALWRKTCEDRSSANILDVLYKRRWTAFVSQREAVAIKPRRADSMSPRGNYQVYLRREETIKASRQTNPPPEATTV